MQPLVWVDIETTGLNAGKNLPLEIALVATDEELRLTTSIALPFWIPEDESVLAENSHPAALVMHTENGLLDHCRAEGLRVPELRDKLMDWIKENEASGRWLAGSNPGFDRSFMQVWLPDVLKQFHYRSFDVNTLLAFHGIDPSALKGKKREHRAVGDVLRDIKVTSRLLNCTSTTRLPSLSDLL
jgi:oligoribonuclease